MSANNQQPPIPIIKFDFLTEMGDYLGTNTIALVKDVDTGGIFYYDNSPNHPDPNGTTVIQSVLGGVWVMIARRGGTGDTTRFGIEDNLGIQNRSVDMETFTFLMNNVSDFLIQNGDPDYVNAESEIHVANQFAALYAQIDGDNTSSIVVNGSVSMSSNADANDRSYTLELNAGLDKLVIGHTYDGGSANLFTFPKPLTPSVNYFLPLTITDGAGTHVADSAGNIQIASGFLLGSQFASAATTTPLPTSTYANGSSGVGATITADTLIALPAQDGITLSADEKLLVKDEVDQIRNGLFDVTEPGVDGVTAFILTRSVGADTTAELYPEGVVVSAGTANANRLFIQITVDPAIGTDPIIYGYSFLVTQKLFGIDDNLGLQNRAVDMQTFNLALTNGGVFSFSGSTVRFSIDNGATWQTIANNNSVNQFIPLSVNGVFADANGNIVVSGIGTVTSVDATAASGMTVTGNPITGSGTLAFAWVGAVQGDLLYFTGNNTVGFLNKDATATPSPARSA